MTTLNKLGEVRAILADMGAESVPPSRLQKSPTYTSTSTLLVSITRLAHKTLYRAGRISNYGYKRKMPNWPFEATSVIVLGYGIEKIAYKVTSTDAKAPVMVVAVYYREPLRKSPDEVIHKKTERYQAYRKYFGDIIVPTTFGEIDNPWGEGTKPASIQPFLDKLERFSDYSQQQVKARAEEDAIFAKDLRSLKCGYDRMLADKHRPDFGGGNLVVVGSNIRIFDTGVLVPSDKYKRLRDASPAYNLVESIDISVLAK